MNAEAGRKLSRLGRGDFVSFLGYPNEGEVSRWHVNHTIHVGRNQNLSRIGIVCQIESADPHWLMIVVQDDEIGELKASEGEPPSGMDADEYAEELDPDSIELVDIERP